MIVDAILFNDELDLLQHRISWLKNHVDVTIILEADFTFSGKPKSLSARPEISKLAKLTEGKVVPIQMLIDTFNGNLPDNPWKIESASRSFLVQYLATNYPQDRVVFADLDEIPSLEQMTLISKLDLDGSLETFSIPMQVYYRYANWSQMGSGKNWNLAKTYHSSFPPAVSEIRSPNNFPNLPGKGSHLSYLAMTAQQITSKFESFSHSELTGFRDIEDFFTRISDYYFVDHIGRFDVRGRGLIQVLNDDQVHDVCAYLAKQDPIFIRSGEMPPLFKRLIASATLTYLRKKKDSPKNLFQKFVESSAKINKPEDIGIFSGSLILVHGYFEILLKNLFQILKRLIPAPIKLRIKKFYGAQ